MSKKYKKNKMSKKNKKYKDYITEYKDEEIKDLTSTRWGSEIVKALIISFATMIITTSLMYIIRKNSSGERRGEELEKYLSQKVVELCKEKLDAYNIKTEVPYSGEYIHLSDDKTILVYGKYNVQKNDKIGRIVVLLKKTEKTILNDILGTQPGYKIVSAYYNTAINSGDGEHYLNYMNVEDCDYDNDGKKEILITFRSNYADRFDTAYLLLTYCDDKWKIVKNDTDKMLSLISKSTKEKNGVCLLNMEPFGLEGEKKDDNIKLNIDKYKFIDLFDEENKYDIYGLYNDGYIMQSSNPLSGECEFCYKISYNMSDSFEKGVVYMMQRYKDGKLFFEKNWNNGLPMVTDESFHFEEDSWQYWGYNRKIDGMIFYGLP